MGGRDVGRGRGREVGGREGGREGHITFAYTQINNTVG